MNKTLLATISAALSAAGAAAAQAAPSAGWRGMPGSPQAGWQPVQPGGPAFRPVQPGWGPGWGSSPGWRPGWGWGPGWRPGWGAGWGTGWSGPVWGAPVVWGGPAFWGAPAVWGAPVVWGGWPNPWAQPVTTLIVNNPAPAPQVFVQEDAARAPESFWYYCTDPAGYFPYVQSCSHTWMKVVPQVPADAPAAPRLAP